jgi:RNA polymerase sigma-70 factor (ECF subfamily)
MLIERGHTSALNWTQPIDDWQSDEAQLIDAARAGEVDAFNRLVVIYQDFAYHLAYRLLGDEAAAADAVQEAFIAAYRRLPMFRAGIFKSWLYRIVINKCYDALRAVRRRPAVSLDELTDEHDDGLHGWLSAPEAGPENTLQRRELTDLLQRHIARLPFDQRTVLVLSDVHGLTHAEIAEITRLKSGTIKSRLSRGRARLRNSLEPVLPFFRSN